MLGSESLHVNLLSTTINLHHSMYHLHYVTSTRTRPWGETGRPAAPPTLQGGERGGKRKEKVMEERKEQGTTLLQAPRQINCLGFSRERPS